MKKIITAILPLLLLGACKKDITSLNDDPKNPLTVPASTLFTQAQRQLVNNLHSSNVYVNTFRLFEQYWTETTYYTESNYNIKDNAIPDEQWTSLYTDVLNNFEQSRLRLPEYVLDENERKNDDALIEIMEVYTWYYLVTTFGDVPYNEALKTSITPKYDDAATVYKALLVRLDAATEALDTSYPSFGSADRIYDGDVAKWIKFANTLKLKMGITIADYDSQLAGTTIQEAVQAGVFTSNDDNADYQYDSNSPNTNPVWVDLVQSGRQDFVAAKTIIDAMKADSDPRLTFYFTTNNAGQYVGGDMGTTNSFGAFSKPGTKITAPDFPGDILDYSETEFALAEAVERGYSVGGTAQTHYNNAITASIEYWGGTETQATAYLARPTVNYLTATGNYKQKIGLQKWRALYNRGWDAWIENRRLDYPELPAPEDPVSDFPVRMTYPVVEQNVNGTNYATAAAAIGGDEVSTKLFFDKF
ncbi:SusD/RagB family nutrient-binding outer membrane lipoprotein [Mucilaginibacter sp. UR6-1]|uniref:SusD/RagB family nutrient-binding outer membrane lipoprotein n=1 Tax=Mucilaginibacter sp. UR6-1 TaxID=1435643 RepID=UPI001E4F5D30|nr:SusD/RagB family nutrient-binding outer membrane lipoprotein [Mucilaginibacter sp. UR6-1]MCC8410123.1 SusD/RagB family nutrient-binding outer membrane lipoprotein [Mucilaginibacter sp. UR6-1]